MMRICSAAAVAALAICVAAPPAAAATKTSNRNNGAKGGIAAIQLACMKQYGAWYDADRKKWVLEGTIYTLPGKIDAVNACVSQRTGIPLTQVPRMNERRLDR